MVTTAVEVSDLWFCHDSGAGAFEIRIGDLRIARGETVSITGPSGSGKSTLLELLVGLKRPAAGDVVCLGVNWAKCSEALRRRNRIARIGLSLQEFRLIDHLTAVENILVPLTLQRTLRGDPGARSRLDRLAEAAELPSSTLGRRPRELSLGERQRVAICRALITQPEFVVLDEPTANLDAMTGRTIHNLLRDDASCRSATLICATHDAALIEFSDRVLDASSYR